MRSVTKRDLITPSSDDAASASRNIHIEHIYQSDKKKKKKQKKNRKNTKQKGGKGRDVGNLLGVESSWTTNEEMSRASPPMLLAWHM